MSGFSAWSGEMVPEIPRGVIAQSPSTLHAFRLAHRVAASAANVLVYGESGTGKEIVARYIHELDLE